MKLEAAQRAMKALLDRGYSVQLNARVMHPDHRLPDFNDEWDPVSEGDLDLQCVFDILILDSLSKGMGIRSIELRELCDIAESVGLTAETHYLDGGKIRFANIRPEIP